MNHYVYETTNLVNGKKYIGKRSCKCPIEEDKYMGSGKLLKKAIDKYGKENFKKDILQICESEEMAYEWEKVYIEQVKAYKNNNYYNIASGGEGGFGNFAGKSAEEIENWKLKIKEYQNRPEVIKKRSEYMKGENNPAKTLSARKKNSEFHKGRIPSKESRLKMSISQRNRKTYGMSGKKLSQEHIEKIRCANRGRKMSEFTKKKLAESKYKPVVCLTLNRVFKSAKEATELLNLPKNKVGACCRGERKSTGGYKFMFLNDYLTTIK